MSEGAASALRAWESFYVIVGSAGAALTGLQFVVLTLISEAGPVRGRKESIAAFGSPNVVHFCAALLVSAILSAPWSGLGYAGTAVAACGVVGVVYSIVVIRRAHRQDSYQPVLEDWVWHNILPLLAYSALFVTGVTLEWSSAGGLFVLGAAVLLLVFIGIHNAWDTVTFITVARGMQEQEAAPGAVSSGDPPAGSPPRNPAASPAVESRTVTLPRPDVHPNPE